MLQKYLFSISDVAKTMFLLYPEVLLIRSLHCQQPEPSCFSVRIEGQVQFQNHISLHILKYAYIKKDMIRKNIQINYCAKVQLLCCFQLLCYIVMVVSWQPVISGVP